MGTSIKMALPDVVIACLGGAFAFLANMISIVMIEKINKRVPANQQISYFGWRTNVRKRFKQIYPGNRLVTLLDSCVVFMIVCFVLLIWFWDFK